MWSFSGFFLQFFSFENTTLLRKNQTDQQHQWIPDLIFRVERFATAKNFLSTLLLASQLPVVWRWRQEQLGDLHLGALDRWRPSGSNEARDNNLRRSLLLLAGNEYFEYKDRTPPIFLRIYIPENCLIFCFVVFLCSIYYFFDHKILPRYPHDRQSQDQNLHNACKFKLSMPIM